MNGSTLFAGLPGGVARPIGRLARMALLCGSLAPVVIVSACSVDAGEKARALSPGDTILTRDLSGSRPALVWVFDAEECLGCELTGPAQSVRLLQRRLGGRMETAVLALSELGEEDGAMVNRFLESQRVSAHVRVRTPGEHSREFGDGPVPAFYIVGEDWVVQAILEPDRADSWRSSDDSLSLADFIETLAEDQKVPDEKPRQ